jgi:4-aminobutyrate aminotransferase-like enzyme
VLGVGARPQGLSSLRYVIEAAFRRRVRGDSVVVFKGSLADASISQPRDFKPPYRVVAIDSPPSSKVWKTAEHLEQRHLREDEKAIVRQFEIAACNAFAIVVEPVQLLNGMRVVSLPLMQALSSIARSSGVSFVVDETLAGLGWTGMLSSAVRYGIHPDIICLGCPAGHSELPTLDLFFGEGWPGVTYGLPDVLLSAEPGALTSLAEWVVGTNRIQETQIVDAIARSSSDMLGCGLFDEYSRKIKLIESYFHEISRMNQPLVFGGVGFGLCRGIRFRSGEYGAAESVVDEVVNEASWHGVSVGRSSNVVVVRPPLSIDWHVLFLGLRRLSDAIRRVALRRGAG